MNSFDYFWQCLLGQYPSDLDVLGVNMLSCFPEITGITSRIRRTRDLVLN